MSRRFASPLSASLVAIVAIAAIAACARAQSAEYTLDDDAGWRQAQPPAPGSDEAVIIDARAALARDQPGRALASISRWIERQESAGASQNRWMADAVLIRGDALLALDREYSALFEYERIAKQFPASDAFVLAAEREFDIAKRYLGGLRRRFLGVRIADATDIGEELLIRIQERLPGSQLAERAGIALADHYYDARDMDLAAVAYDLYLKNYPRGEWRVHAMRRRIFANLAQFKGPQYDSTSLLDAREQILQFAAIFPSEAEDVSPIVSRIDDSLAARALDGARWYLKRGDAAGARYTLRRLLRDHPRSAAAAEALRIMAARGWIEQSAGTTGVGGETPASDHPSKPAQPTKTKGEAGADDPGGRQP